MNVIPTSERRVLADTLRTHREAVAARMTDAFLERHPDWVRRYGDVARVRGLEDARFHIDFLAGAVQAGSHDAFETYARWTARVLGSRGIAPTFLIENLEQLEAELVALVGERDAATIQGYLDAGVASIRAGVAPTVGPGPSDDLTTDLKLYLDAILGGHRTAALNVALEVLRKDVSVPDVYMRLLQPAQYEVGRLWEQNEISVSTEHMATAITQYVVAQLYSRLEIPDRTRGNAIVTGVEGELHQLGANMVADVLESDGWNVRFLGTQMPHRDILRAIAEHRPVLVGISTTMLFNLPNVASLVEQIRRSADDDLQIIVGGGAFRDQTNAWREVGADGQGRDLRDTLEMVRTLMPRH